MIWVIHGILIVSAAFFFVLALIDFMAARAPSAGPSKAALPKSLVNGHGLLHLRHAAKCVEERGHHSREE